MRLHRGVGPIAVALAVAVVGMNLTARSALAADVTGTWKWSFTTQNGDTREVTLKLKQEGEKLTGTITGRNNQETKIENGKVKGDEISFEVTRERNGEKFTQKYSGKLEGDTIKGKIKMTFNGEERERDWEAKKS